MYNLLIIKIILLIIFLTDSHNLQATEISIKGSISSLEGNIPVQGAAVHLNNVKAGISDPKGNFYLKDIKPGIYLITIFCLGFETYTETLELISNKRLNIFLKKDSISLSEITIRSGSKLNSTETLNNLDKLLRPVNNSQDLLTLVPGLFIAQHAGGGKAEQIFLRGFDSDHGTDFYISVDGMPVNMVSHAHGQGYADFHFVIPETIDKLKVYKGPYNARFGDFSTSGTGEFFTKNALEASEIKVEAGMFDTYRVLGMNKIPTRKPILFKENENAFVAGEYVFTNSYFNKKQNLNRLNLFGKYSGKPDAHNFLTLSASTFYGSWDASGQIPERAVDSIGRYGSIDPTEGGKTRRTNINITNTTTNNDGSILKNQIYYVNYYFNLFSNFTFFLNDPIHGDEIAQTDKRNILGYSGSYLKEFEISNIPVYLNFGIGTRNDHAKITLRNAEKRIILDTIVDGFVKQQNSNAYIDLTIQLSKNFSINTGLRYDYFRFNFNDYQHDSLSGVKSISILNPKINFYYNLSDRIRLFIKSGIGFHSNDARSVVINKTNNSLPRAYGYEAGSEFKLTEKILINMALWSLYLESELVYIGDEGTVETNNPTQRYGIDLGVRCQLGQNLYADMDLNYNHGRLVNTPDGEDYIPLAPGLTSAGGITYKQDKGFNFGIRYRFINSRSANENNSITAKGYCLFDATVAYSIKRFEIGLTAENLLNSKWNQAQFDIKSRLFNETDPISELHFTPGTPLFIKASAKISF